MQVDSRLSDVEVLRGIIDAIPHPIFVKDEQSRFLIVNDAMCQLMGRTFSEVVGRRDHDLVPHDEADLYVDKDLQVLQSGIVNENEEPFTGEGGEARTIITRKARISVRGGAPLLIGCITDISDFRKAEAAIRHNAEHDYLTGIGNRALFNKRLAEALAAPATPGSPAALLLVDMDGFKRVNDILGHAAGDNLLVQTANALAELAGSGDNVARLGGDEFAFVQQPLPQPSSAIGLARAAIRRLARPAYHGHTQIALSASIGIAFAGETPRDEDTLMQQADAALYCAKREGRNCWRIYGEGGLGGTLDRAVAV